MAARPRKCKSCTEPFVPVRPMQNVCSQPCAVTLARQKEAKKALREVRRFKREGRERIKTRRDLEKEAQSAVNAYVRFRDRARPCISCGTPGNAEALRGGYWDAGHYKSVGAHPELRFWLWNIAKQCKKCNQHKSGDVVNYRGSLLERIGHKRLAFIEGPHQARKYSAEELRRIRDIFRRRLRVKRRLL